MTRQLYPRLASYREILCCAGVRYSFFIISADPDLPLNQKGGVTMGEILVSLAIGGFLVAAGILMNIHLRREEKSLEKEKP